MPSPKRVLVTGGAGFIGSHTVDRLLSLGHTVRVLDSLAERIHPHGRPDYLTDDVEFHRADVRDRDAMLRAMRGVDVVYHLAAYQDYHTDFSTFLDTNATSTALIYELIVTEKLPVERVVVASSQFVQGEGLYRAPDGTAISPTLRSEEQLARGEWEFTDSEGAALEPLWTGEDHAAPANAYAISKYAQELQALRFGERYSIPSTALRYSIVQGSRQSFHNAYSGACRIFSLHYHFGRAPIVYEDGLQTRDFVNIHDVVDANIVAMEHPDAVWRVFNVGGGVRWRLIDFARAVAQEFGHPELEPQVPGLYRFGDTRHANSSIDRLRSLGWAPRRTVEDSIREYAEWLRSRTDIDDILERSMQTMQQQNVVRRIMNDEL